MTEQVKKKIIWNDTNMNSSYANVANVSSTREEFNLLFGTNRNWNQAQRDVVIELNERIVMNPLAAKRLSILLSQAVAKYEAQIGELDLGFSETPIKVEVESPEGETVQ